jgi:flagellar basal-body rod protein FlgF
MSYGLQISASGAMTAMYRQDVFANNLANIDTVGFKPDIATSRPRDAARREDGLPFLPSNALLERLGAGTMLNPNLIDFSQGALKTTGNALDLAIQGDGFFVVRDETDGATDRVRLTRDGRFTRDRDGRIVSASTGMPLLDVNNRPIVLRNGDVTIAGDGSVRQGGEVVARVQVTDVADRSRLTKLGHSLFAADDRALAARREGTGSVAQFAVEDSGADEIQTLMRLTSAAREVDSNLSMIQTHDRLMERAIASLGRVT